jgi:hypothetical protein
MAASSFLGDFRDYFLLVDLLRAEEPVVASEAFLFAVHAILGDAARAGGVIALNAGAISPIRGSGSEVKRISGRPNKA